MKELDYLNIIKQNIGSDYIGDDCAFLKDLGIVVTQDSLIEGVHFKREWYSPYELGYKSAAVNISDILASGGKPKYLTIALSLPNDINNDFVDEFYKGVMSCTKNVSIIGGDITGSKRDIAVSVTAIGRTKDRKISSRKNAKAGYVVVTKGLHGLSAMGLKELLEGKKHSEFIKAHKMPELEYEFSELIAKNIKEDYAMMDTSDGLADALFKIAEASDVKIKVDYNKIPKAENIDKDMVLFGGEDYKLVAAIPYNIAQLSGGTVIGTVETFDGYTLEIDSQKFKSYDELNVFNHFCE